MSDLFKNKKYNQSKLLTFGFKEVDNGYVIEKPLMDNQFELSVFVGLDNVITTKLVEVETGEVYSLHLVEGASGNFVGQIREEYNCFLENVADNCFEADVFKSEVTLELIEYVRNKYGDELEFLWEKFAGNAVVRRKDNSKWYGAFLTVSKSKLGFEDLDKVEVIDLRAENVENIVDNKLIFGGYHMNKKHWITIILDGSVPVEKIKTMIDESYILANKKRRS